MKKLILILALALGGCASLQSTYDVISGATVTPQQVYLARNAFDTVEVTATNYITYCKVHPTTPGCSKTAIAQLIPAVRSGRVARNNLVQFQKSNPTAGSPSNLYNVLITATNTIQQIQSIYKVQQ